MRHVSDTAERKPEVGVIAGLAWTPVGGDILWNFQKYLVDREGNLVAKIGPQTTPEDPTVTSQIEALL